MSREEKFKIYIDYVVLQSELKNNFYVVDRKDWMGWGKPYKIVHNIGFFRKDACYPTLSFDDFINESKQVSIFDAGENWKERGYAQRYIEHTHGLTDWIKKHK